ncbi:MAG: hypothetical protein IPK03_13355 [Bacteroidetes bacterium]|nr:hypothetical protein [Bacteroidota bacterium]
MFSIVKSVEVDLDAEIKGMELIDSRMVNNNIVLITELEQSKEGKINNYVWTLNTQTMEFDKPKMILEVSQKIIKESRLPFFDFDLTNQNYNDDRIVYYSEDNSKFAILASIPLSGKEKGRFNKRLLTVYDLSLNKLWSSELDMIQNHDFFVNIVTTLGNDGSFYSIGIAYNSVSDMKQKSNGIYTLRKFDNNGKGEDFSLNFGNKK